MTPTKLLLILSVLSMVNPISAAADISPTKILIAIAEPGYHTEVTLPAFAKKFWTADNGYNVTVIEGDPAAHNLPNLDTLLPGADVLVLSIRRQALPAAQLQAIRDHLNAGKPLLAIRTSSHGLTAVGKGPAGHPEWDSFDTEVLGAGYRTHAGHKLTATFSTAKGAESHPILKDVKLPFSSGGGIYFSTEHANTTTPLLIGTLEGHDPEPIAWTNTYGKANAKIFYTSLGQEEEFASPSFQKLLTNAMTWLTN